MSPRLTGTTAQDTTAHRTVDCIINPPLHSLLASLAFSHVDERCPHGHRTACSARRCTHNCSRQSGELHAAHEHSIAVVRCPSRPQALGDALRDSVDGPNWTFANGPPRPLFNSPSARLGQVAGLTPQAEMEQTPAAWTVRSVTLPFSPR